MLIHLIIMPLKSLTKCAILGDLVQLIFLIFFPQKRNIHALVLWRKHALSLVGIIVKLLS